MTRCPLCLYELSADRSAFVCAGDCEEIPDSQFSRHYGVDRRSRTLTIVDRPADTRSWTVPTGVTSVDVLVVGGGGAGGNALLQSSIVPYSQISLSGQIRILSCYEASGDFAAIMNSHPAIDESNIRHVIRQYRCHWRQRRLAIGLTLSMTRHFISQCFKGFGRQFMQIKPTPNVFFPEPT